ncbi:origin recognition complex subunit 2-domain-containing protein [Gamsiella multidivaricata]|uniref:origin recognition complex subunit 2-domain-containing protein n=1 Tax=Gamsiella multidivaricata TaxID=101098 RepID=UPI00221EEF99|nr:origin recognition complex subunit 2-domain-containing protein [Gamsiella multidivaricata]KAG0371179.1 Origin recognition complex subunit 2 [Gamsiella multidivaricata]KAI7823614.1 origin recognition complex subunit 2-domain-containing protein [Gamsiella multidivaricata]
MVCIVYQGNDVIPTHINCRVSAQDAERESVLTKRFKHAVQSNIPRKRRIGIQSGLTVDKTNDLSIKHRNIQEDAESAAALQDVFLPTSTSADASSSISVQADTIMAPSTLEENDAAAIVRHARGREVFGFQTQRKIAGLKSIIDHQQEQQSTVKTNNRKNSTKVSSAAGATVSAADHEVKRRRFTRTVSRMNQASSEEDEEDEDHDSEDEGESDDDRREGQRDFADTIVHDAQDAQKSFFEEDEMGAERYFQDLHQKSKTSNNTLSKLPTLEHADFIQALKRTPTKHSKEMEMLMLLYEEQFPQWYFELMSGFNLLIYGYGSKRALLTKFATTVLTDAPLILVNGYFPTLTVREILSKISSEALQYSGPTGTLQEQIALIQAYFSQPDRAIQKLYLIIHNIDGSSLRSEKTQSALSLLASCPHIHLVASMDHINTNILWDTVKAARFRWVWHELTTFRPYLAETSYENSIMVRQGELGARGIQFVLASLTSNGKGLFRILAEHQIQSERDVVEGGAASTGSKNQMDYGMAHSTLFKKCQENFLVSNAMTFRTQLTEFRDHRIVQSKKGADGVEILYIPLSAGVLEGILEQLS